MYFEDLKVGMTVETEPAVIRLEKMKAELPGMKNR